MLQTLEAIVLKPTPFQEGGLVVSFLTEHGERAVGLARGAKKPTAKWVSAFEPMSLVRASFFGREHTEVRRITRCELKHSPLTLGHLESSLVIPCIADLFDRIAKEGVEDERLFRLLSSCARELGVRPDRAMAVLAYAEHWLLHCLGLLPNPRACGRCGRDASPFVMLSDDQGWCCADCTPVDPGEALPPGVREHLNELRSQSPDGAPEPDWNPAAKAATALLRERLLRELGGSLKSYEVLRKSLLV